MPWWFLHRTPHYLCCAAPLPAADAPCRPHVAGVPADSAAVAAAVLSRIAAGDASGAGALMLRAFQNEWGGDTTLAMLAQLNGFVLQLGCRPDIKAAIAGGVVWIGLPGPCLPAAAVLL